MIYYHVHTNKSNNTINTQSYTLDKKRSLVILKFFSHWDAWIGWSKREGREEDGSSSLQFFTHR